MSNKIWQPFKIGSVLVNNRILRSATHEGFADKEGKPGKKHIELYSRLAKGGVGAIITGYAGIQQDGKSPYYNMLMIDSDKHIDAYKRVTKAVHDNNTSIFLQIAHCGRATRSAVTGLPTVAPSAVKDKMYPETVPGELTEEQIYEIIYNFIRAAERAEKAGFDGVQLHLAHGYLLAQFLSNYSNRRKDKWGGILENRFRTVKEIITGIKKKLPDFPVLVKLNAYDNRKKGMRIEEAVMIAELLEKAGCDAIEVSCGFPEDGGLSARSVEIPFEAVFRFHSGFKNLHPAVKFFIKKFSALLYDNRIKQNSYNVDAAVQIKKAVSIPVFAVGGIDSLDSITNALEKKGLDAVSMCRPLILEPQLIRSFQEGKSEKAKCIKCNYCGVIQEERPLRCYYGKLPL